MPDQRTEHRDYPLPHPDNYLFDDDGGDMARMRTSFRRIDADIHHSNEHIKRIQEKLETLEFENHIGLWSKT